MAMLPSKQVRMPETTLELQASLDRATSLPDVVEVVRHAARQSVGADGATFVLREADHCFYVDEDAIAPLWKGQRFPITTCISGWAMLHAQPAVIPDILLDERIPQDAYRPTFVQSLAMVPIGNENPVGAIGAYWARRNGPTSDDVSSLQHIAQLTACALDRVGLASAPWAPSFRHGVFEEPVSRGA
jgi:GAF domain-containing protein